MSRTPPLREAVARFLRQKKELGVGDLFLESLTREQLLAVAAEAGEGVVRPDGPAATSANPADPAARTAAAAAGPARDATGSAAPSPEIDLAGLDYGALEATALACRRCRLAEGRTQVVFSDGNPQARLMVVGEAPGANEDRTGLPFVGQAGKMLDLLLAAVDLSRKDSVYICNVLKCRPPGNRNPLTDEIELCAPYLKRQIALVAPEAILAVGTFAAQLLTGTTHPLGKLRSSVYSYEGVPLVVTYHPAALLRNPGWTRSTWDDLQLLRQVMDGS